jgi:eukaryotic-like serine/threonine-protein kinase
MAPEQIMAAREVTASADIYALGVVAFEAITGQHPFRGASANAGQMVFAHLQQPPPLAHAIASDIPPAISQVLVQALSKAPQDRPKRAGDFATALRLAIQQSTLDSALPAPIRVPAATASR